MPLSHLPPLGPNFDGWRDHPDVEPLSDGDRGISKAWIVGGKHFVKANDRGFSDLKRGSRPWLLLKHLGLSHNPVSYVEHRGTPLLVSSYHHDWIPATRLQSMDHIDPQHLADTIYGEWLHGIGDRHTGNYLIHPPTGRVMSIDHGMLEAPDHGIYGALYHLMKHEDPAFSRHPISPELVEKSLDPKYHQMAKLLKLYTSGHDRIKSIRRKFPDTQINLAHLA